MARTKLSLDSFALNIKLKGIDFRQQLVIQNEDRQGFKSFLYPMKTSGKQSDIPVENPRFSG